MSKDSRIAKKFINEVFSVALRNKGMALIMVDFLKEEYMPNDEYRKILKAFKRHWQTYHKPITIGGLYQKFDDDDDVLDVVDDLKDTDVHDSPEDLIDEIEEFIVKNMFVQGYDEMGVMYNKGQKEKAVKHLVELAEGFNNFSIKKDIFHKVIGGFVDRALDARTKKNADDFGDDISYLGIDAIDELTKGHKKSKGNLVVFEAASGGGKTKALRFVGAHNVQRGKNVFHLQLEGTEEEALSGYDATLTGVHSSTIEAGLMDASKLEGFTKMANRFEGEIFVKAYEKFSVSPSCNDIRKMILDIEKSHGIVIDVLIVDYMELLDTSDGRDWSPNDERHRRAKIADELMDVSKNLKVAVITATQANSVNPNDLNDPSFVLTRYNVSEAKGIIKPCTLFITINRTLEESEDEILRLYVDKSRYSKAGMTIPICTNFAVDKFYDRKRTMAMVEE